MFYYYGRKKQIAKYYPKPNYSVIIEPFAGAAAYSLFDTNWQRQVILNERDEKVYQIWDWLINSATEREIKNLPELQVGEKSSEFLHIVHAATKMAFHFKTIKVTPVLARNWEISRRFFLRDLHKIKHWQIYNKDYSEIENIEGTWFIDPPYMGDSGMGYRYNSKMLDYEALARWALSRKGEIIFCEGNDADYLPFRPLLELKGVAGKTSKEKIFYKSPYLNPEELQLSLFAEKF